LRSSTATLPTSFGGRETSLPYSFGYRYDKLNRLKKGITAGLTNVMSEQMEYDVMGNFKWLSRDGGNANHYDYPHGNQLWYVAYVTNGYAYDANGNATTDGRSGYTIQYNHLNLPRYIPDVKLTYTYDATGRKISKNNNGSFRNYIDGIEYKPDGTIDFIQTAEGLAQNNGGTYTYHYNLSDHLGNVRYSFDVANGVIGKLEQTDYYPFGMRRNTFASGANNKYLYNGKEMQDELGPPGQEGHYDYGARFYDPVIARWSVVDPAAELMRRYSPYSYSFNNPLRFTDPDGMVPNDIHLKYANASAQAEYAKEVNKALGGQFEIKSTAITKDGKGYDNKISIVATANGGDLTKLTAEQKAFYNLYSDAVNSSSVVRQEVVQNDASTVVGSYLTNKIDIADIKEFDKAGAGAASSAGAIIHETTEQLEKAKAGLNPGDWSKTVSTSVMSPEFLKNHARAVKAENKVNGNSRNDQTDVFTDKNGKKTNQTVTPTSSGGITVTKTKIP